MELQIDKYDMTVKDVVSVVFKDLNVAPKKDEDGNKLVWSYFALKNIKKKIVWDANLWIPRSVIDAGEDLCAGPQLQKDVDTINAFTASIGAPEVKIKLDQTVQEIVEEPTEENGLIPE